MTNKQTNNPKTCFFCKVFSLFSFRLPRQQKYEESCDDICVCVCVPWSNLFLSSTKFWRFWRRVPHSWRTPTGQRSSSNDAKHLHLNRKKYSNGSSWSTTLTRSSSSFVENVSRRKKRPNQEEDLLRGQHHHRRRRIQVTFANRECYKGWALMTSR